MKTGVVFSLCGEHKLSYLLDAAGLAKSTYYYQLAGLGSVDKYAGVKYAIAEIFHKSKQRFGYRRVWAALQHAGYRLSKTTVHRLMHQMGLRSKVRPRRNRYFGGGKVSDVAPNVLNREFDAKAPNQKWVSDITQFPPISGLKVFVVFICDLFDRYILSAARLV